MLKIRCKQLIPIIHRQRQSVPNNPSLIRPHHTQDSSSFWIFKSVLLNLSSNSSPEEIRRQRKFVARGNLLPKENSSEKEIHCQFHHQGKIVFRRNSLPITSPEEIRHKSQFVTNNWWRTYSCDELKKLLAWGNSSPITSPKEIHHQRQFVTITSPEEILC